MTPRFTPCPSCARHVKQSDCTCPFCGGEVAHVTARARVAVGRLSRSALFAAGAAGLALATTDCSSNSIVPYGVPPCTGTDADGCYGITGLDASADASDASSSTPDAAEAGPTEGGSDGAATTPTDGGEAGH